MCVLEVGGGEEKKIPTEGRKSFSPLTPRSILSPPQLDPPPRKNALHIDIPGRRLRKKKRRDGMPPFVYDRRPHCYR